MGMHVAACMDVCADAIEHTAGQLFAIAAELFLHQLDHLGHLFEVFVTVFQPLPPPVQQEPAVQAARYLVGIVGVFAKHAPILALRK
jgi:hypothetical protein